MPPIARAAVALLLFLDVINLSCAHRDFIRKSDLSKVIPQSGENNWISLDPDTQFLPADVSGAAFSSEVARRLASSTSSYNPYASQPFANGQYEYNGYQQAWRYLGFVIDCDSNVSEQGDHHSGDGTGEGCSRFVLWAAYVDLDYQGGGIGEYQYWDRWTNSWDTTSCNFASQQSGDRNGNNNNNNNQNANGEARCAKMDCHLEDTHFTPLGFFKHKDYDEWMGQLFKHEGMCIWTSDEYSFMKNARKAWPNGCMVSGSYYDGDKPLYYDLKPASKGDITVGLYTDTRCTVEYVSQGQDDPITVENVVGNIIMNGGSGKSRDGNGDNSGYSTLAEAQATWDSAFDIFKICQPCIAHDLTNVGHNADDDSVKGSGYYSYYGNDGGGGGGDDFDCYDDAGYTNVNQCMKFMAKTTMYAATWRDLSLAMDQNVLVDNPLAGTGSTVSSFSASGRLSAEKVQSAFTVVFFAFSCFVLLVSFLWVRRVRRTSAPRFPLKQPLVIT